MPELPSDRVPRNAPSIRRRLLSFYDDGARDLPWRGETDPYRIWISEVMLQQTRVDTVIGYYQRWVERFPGVDALADAGTEEVLQLWKGLGYYSRARNLREAAVVLRDRHDGVLPRTVPLLRELPGVGEYTAGAVASIAFGIPVPAVDGNVRRVLARLFNLPAPGATQLTRLAGALVCPDRPGDFNQALMELGATVCTPRSPECGACPVAAECRARSAGTVAERPPPRKRAAVRNVEIGVAVVVARSPAPRVLVRRRPDGGLLPGLWEFPGEGSLEGEAPPEAARRALRSCAPAWADVAREGRPLPDVVHRFSHLKARYRPVLFTTDGATSDVAPERDGVRWLPIDALDSVPLPVAQQRIGQAMLEEIAEGEGARRALNSPRTGRSPGTPSAGPRDGRERSLPRRSG